MESSGSVWAGDGGLVGSWLRRVDDDAAGVHDLEEDGWSFTTYAALRAQARSIAAAVLDRTGGDPFVALVVLPAGSAFIATFYGLIAAGGTVAACAPPRAFIGLGSYDDHVRRACETTAARFVVTGAADFVTVRRAVSPLVDVLTTDVLSDHEPASLWAPPSATAVIQLTSGSTGHPKGVALTMANLNENVASILDWLHLTPSDEGVTWLPVHHDFGLVGATLPAVEVGASLRIMQPGTFIRSPASWLDCLGRLGSTFTATPTFGLAHVARRVRPDRLVDHDFSDVRGVVIGAERVEAHTLKRFIDLLAPHGFRENALMPAYGMAEVTLGATGSRVDAPPMAVRVASQRSGTRVEILEGPRPLTDLAEGPTGSLLVGCGQPLRGLTVTVCDHHGPVPDRTVGEIVVESPSVAEGYVNGNELVRRFAGRFDTGDLGFTVGGELFVLGRVGDGINVRGELILAEDVEAAVAEALGGRAARLCALLYEDETGAHAVVLVEGRMERDALSIAFDAARRTLDRPTSVEIIATALGTIQRTTSGKPKRKATLYDLAAGMIVPRERLLG